MKVSVLVTDRPISPSPLVFPAEGSAGAISEFWGVVREMEKDQKISHLYYESYNPMAEKKMREILETLSSSHPCHSVEVIHRLGKIPVGEPSLWIRAISKHRREAIHLIDQFIIRMKEDVPIWKTF